jgi:hypothetical protein
MSSILQGMVFASAVFCTLVLIYLSAEMRLPYDILNVVAEILAEDGQMQTLARLNVSCRAMQQETVACLYERMSIKEDEDFDYVRGYDLPRGWKHVK